MLKRTTPAGPTVKVTFTLPVSDFDHPISVLGDFNDWDPLAHPLKKRSNGTRSVSVDLPAGSMVHFKYLAADGTWFCDEGADGVEANEYGEVNSVLMT